VIGLNQPTVTTGATLSPRYSLDTSGDGYVDSLDWVAADQSSVLPTAGPQFEAPIATPDPGTTAFPIAPVDTCDNTWDEVTHSGCLVTAVSHEPYPSGTIVAFVLKFTASGPGTYLMDMDDDGQHLSWTNIGGNTSNTYTQARVNIVPLPAAGSLLAPAFGVIGWLTIRRRFAVN
jgi:hypothetical protein